MIIPMDWVIAFYSELQSFAFQKIPKLKNKEFFVKATSQNDTGVPPSSNEQ